jgi:hypothetical protein
MTDPPSRRDPLSTIAGWMALIAAVGVAMGLLIVAPGLSFLVVLILFETLAAIRFKAYRRRGKPMSGCVETAWVLTFLIVIPIMSVVAVLIGLFAYCSMNPGALRLG